MIKRTPDQDRIVSGDRGQQIATELCQGTGARISEADCCLIQRTPDRDRIVSGDRGKAWQGRVVVDIKIKPDQDRIVSGDRGHTGQGQVVL